MAASTQAVAFIAALAGAVSAANAETYVADCRFPTYARAEFDPGGAAPTFRTGTTGRRYRFYFFAPADPYRDVPGVFDYEIDGALVRRDLTYFFGPNQVLFRYTENDPRQGFVHMVASIVFERRSPDDTGVGRLPTRGDTVRRPAVIATQGNVENEPLFHQRIGFCAVGVGRVPPVDAL